MKKILVLMISIVMIMSLVACGSATNTAKNTEGGTAGKATAETIVLQLGVAQEDSNPYSQGAKYLSELVDKKSEGRIKIDVYTNGQLGGESDMTEAVSLGTLDICLTSNAPLTNFSERFNLFELPYLFLDFDHVDAVLDGDVGAELMNDLEAINIVGLAYYENGFRNISNSIREINTPGDLKGIKLRTMESAVHIAAFKALGANPTPMAWGEVYTALQQGTIDGQENPLLAIKGQKIYEVNQYLSMTEHVYTPVELIMNMEKFNSLSEEDQALLKECSQESAIYERGIARKINSDVDFFTEQGITVSYPDKKPFQKIAMAVWEDFSAPLGDLIERVQALAD